MPKKCESCMHFEPSRLFTEASCTSVNVRFGTSARMALPIENAREICDKEGDGIFVYYDPKEPATGRTFAQAA